MDEMMQLYPLCYAKGIDGNSFNERELETSLTIDQKVELKLNAGITPTIDEERRCTLPYDLPGEKWSPLTESITPGKFISNKRRMKNGNGITSQNKSGVVHYSSVNGFVNDNTNKLVIEHFPLDEIRFSPEIMRTLMKISKKENLTADDIENFTINLPLPGEEWRFCVGYEGRYEVSNFGRIRNYTSKAILLRQKDKGYRRVEVSTTPERFDAQYVYVHRLVLDAFKPRTEEDIRLGRDEINHINGDKHDNHVDNLEWVTHKENMMHAVGTGLMKSSLTHDMLALAVKMYDEDKMEIADILAHPAFAYLHMDYMGMYKAIFRLRYKRFTDIPIPKARPTCVKGKPQAHHDVSVEQVIKTRLMKDRGFTYKQIGKALDLPKHVVAAIGKNYSKKNILNSDYPDLVAKITAELDNQ